VTTAGWIGAVTIGAEAKGTGIKPDGAVADIVTRQQATSANSD